MPAYYEENRFRPSAEFHTSVPNQPDTPPTHGPDPRNLKSFGSNVTARAPSLGQAAAENSGSLVSIAGDLMRWGAENVRNSDIQSVEQQVERQTPLGEHVTIVIANPGSVTGNLEVHLYKGDDGSVGPMFLPDTSVRIDVTGQDFRNAIMPQKMIVDVPRQNPQSLPVNRIHNSIDREPRDIPHGTPREVSPDSRYDRDYPGYRDPGSLA